MWQKLWFSTIWRLSSLKTGRCELSSSLCVRMCNIFISHGLSVKQLPDDRTFSRFEREKFFGLLVSRQNTSSFAPKPSSKLPINLPMTAPRRSSVAYIMPAISLIGQLVKDYGTWNMPFCAILWHNFMLIHAVYYVGCWMVWLVSPLKTIVPGTCHSVLYFNILHTFLLKTIVPGTYHSVLHFSISSYN